VDPRIILTLSTQNSAYSTTMDSSASNASAALPLSELRPWISKETFLWIEQADKKEAEFKKVMDDEGADAVAGLFDNDDDEDDAITDRVQSWSSSLVNPNGIGGYQGNDGTGEVTGVNEEEQEEGSLRVLFVLSESWEGFGGLLWASARHVANILADEGKCRRLLEPLLKQRVVQGEEEEKGHPLLGASFLELGAGAGVPSWTAMWCGARVVCTDLSKENRVRCMAESIERNWRELQKAKSLNSDDTILLNARKARSCPHDWGTPIDRVAQALNEDGSERFDVIVAADCLYMPAFHSELLDSIDRLLSNRGVALLPFALHGNTDDTSVWGIVDIAKQKGFSVETLDSQQLIPSYNGMGSKQGLVHTLRLVKK